MLALTIARYALLISSLVWAAALVLAAAGAPGFELWFLVALVSSGWIVLTSLACVLLQIFVAVRRRPTPPRTRGDGAA